MESSEKALFRVRTQKRAFFRQKFKNKAFLFPIIMYFCIDL